MPPEVPSHIIRFSRSDQTSTTAHRSCSPHTSNSSTPENNSPTHETIHHHSNKKQKEKKLKGSKS
ncbi:unnamed protein product, partial [Arabidopsis halleri]